MKLTKEELIAAYSAKDKVNEFIRGRVYGMVEAENEECRKPGCIRMASDDS